MGGNKESINLWKSIREYLTNSLVETACSTLKRLFRGNLKSEKFKNISSESIFRYYVLNRMYDAQNVK